MLATTRAALHLLVEHELPVEPLPDEAVVDLFVSRAAAAGRRVDADAAVAEVCRRLDNLPLALEFAAARAEPAQASCGPPSAMSTNAVI